MELPFKAVIFDMDGTLIASTQADYLAWQKLLAEYGVPLPYEDYFPLLGMRSMDLVRMKLQLEGPAADKALEKKMQYFKEGVKEEGIERIPFSRSFLTELKEYSVRLALATSSRKPKTELVMEHTGLLEFFEIIVTGEDVKNGKPAPDIFLRAAGKLQVAPEDCLVFEDAASGVEAAKSAGMKCVAITTTHGDSELKKADLIIERFEGLHVPELCAVLYPDYPAPAAGTGN